MSTYSQDKGPTILIVMWTTTSIAIIFVIARLYTRYRIVKNPGLDDILITVSIVIGCLFVSLTTAAVKAGLGKHSMSLSTDQFERAAMLNIAGFAPGIISFIVPKFAVVTLLTRLLNPTKTMRLLLWCIVGIGALFICGCIVIIYGQCRPTRALWTPHLQDSSCWDPWILVYYSIVAGAISASLDLFLALYPAFVLRKLQMRMKKKIGLIIAFCLGSCACAVAAYKCTQLPGLADESDSTYSTAGLVIWTNVESNSIIVAACIPTLIPLWELIFDRNSFYSRYGRGSIFRLSSFDFPWKGQKKNRIHENGRADKKLGSIQRTKEVTICFDRPPNGEKVQSS